MAAVHTMDGVEGGSIEAGPVLSESSTGDPKRPQFGTRLLTDPRQVFQHNAWDNVEWTGEQEEAAKKKVLENSQPLPSEKQEEYDNRANEYWNEFYTIHENRFFKDRHWLFTEFPELAPQCGLNHESQSDLTGPYPRQHMDADGRQCGDLAALSLDGCGFPGSAAAYRILEASFPPFHRAHSKIKQNIRIINCGCLGLGAALPFSDPGLFVYCCDFSSTAVELVKTNPEYDPERCFAFVHDLSDGEVQYPVPDGTLDVIVLIFVLSALHPDKMQSSITRLARLLRPGGTMLLRDYGRYDMAQLRFKKGRCLSENFYVRGDGTRVYFFTQEELHELFTGAGLEKVQNLVDRRLQVNRGKQLTMYRVWIQCKYRRAS
ncbi:unnamed protein product [Menidia menidia]|uniref:tRNA N(3)-cytidine methyltransferase n=1 Tax=Menidia menidia TaxID=238744 RepID=A0A8S4AUD3_9TELE|nr:unnamed protein product [Menidia menidia]